MWFSRSKKGGGSDDSKAPENINWKGLANMLYKDYKDECTGPAIAARHRGIVILAGLSKACELNEGQFAKTNAVLPKWDLISRAVEAMNRAAGPHGQSQILENLLEHTNRAAKLISWNETMARSIVEGYMMSCHARMDTFMEYNAELNKMLIHATGINEQLLLRKGKPPEAQD